MGALGEQYYRCRAVYDAQCEENSLLGGNDAVLSHYL